MEGNNFVYNCIYYLLIGLVIYSLTYSSQINTLGSINANEVNAFNGNKTILNTVLNSASNGVSNNVDSVVNTMINGRMVAPKGSFKWKSTTGEETIIADVALNKEDVVLYLIMPDGTTWKASEVKVPYNPYFRDYIIDQNVIANWEKELFPNRIPNTEEYWHDYLPKYSSNYDVREGAYLGITSSAVPPTNIPKYLGNYLMKDSEYDEVNISEKVRLPNDFVSNLPDLSRPVESIGLASQGGGVVSYMHNFKKRQVPYESLLDMPHSAGNYCKMRPQPVGSVINNIASGRRSII